MFKRSRADARDSSENSNNETADVVVEAGEVEGGHGVQMLRREVLHPMMETGRLSMVVVASSVAGVVGGFLLAVAALAPVRFDHRLATPVAAQVAHQNQITYLGVVVSTDRGPDREALGARVVEVLPGSPAFRAGLRVGDVVTRLDENEVRSARDLVRAVRVRPAFQSVILETTNTQTFEMALRRAELGSVDRRLLEQTVYSRRSLLRANCSH